MKKQGKKVYTKRNENRKVDNRFLLIKKSKYYFIFYLYLFPFKSLTLQPCCTAQQLVMPGE